MSDEHPVWTTHEWVTWKDQDPTVRRWPTQTVVCKTDGCLMKGSLKTVPKIGQDVECGGCKRLIVRGTGQA